MKSGSEVGQYFLWTLRSTFQSVSILDFARGTALRAVIEYPHAARLVFGKHNLTSPSNFSAVTEPNLAGILCWLWGTI